MSVVQVHPPPLRAFCVFSGGVAQLVEQSKKYPVVFGELDEWSKSLHWKCSCHANGTRVRIPYSLPHYVRV